MTSIINKSKSKGETDVTVTFTEEMAVNAMEGNKCIDTTARLWHLI
jgi:hypothetical protein